MTEVQIFNHPEFGGVRTIGDADNPKFCLSDVCRIMEIGNPSDVKNRLGDGVVSIEVITDSLGREQKAATLKIATIFICQTNHLPLKVKSSTRRLAKL